MVKTFDGKDVYIPNGQILKNPLTNFTIDGFLRFDFEIALYRGSDVDRAMEILLNILYEIFTAPSSPFCAPRESVRRCLLPCNAA